MVFLSRQLLRCFSGLFVHTYTNTYMHARHTHAKRNGWALKRSLLVVLHYTFLSPYVVSPTNSVPITSSDYAKFSILSIKHRENFAGPWVVLLSAEHSRIVGPNMWVRATLGIE